MSYVSKIPLIARELEPAITAALNAGAHLVEAGAKERVPVESGRLREAIHVEREKDDFYVVAGDTDAFYGHIVEHGGARLPPRPFLIPSLEENTAQIVALTTAAIRKVV
jgi:HK97 gp10 family phage protein